MNRNSQLSRSNRHTHAKSKEKHRRILDAAAKALAEKGYAEAKLSDIAKEAGTHAGSLYYYFPSREDLLREVLLTAVDRLSELASPLEYEKSHPSPLDRLLAFIRNLVEQLTSMRNDNYLRAYLRNYDQVPDGMRTDLKTRRRQIRRTLTRLMQEAQDAGQIPETVDLGIATQFILGATNWVGLWYQPEGRTSADQLTTTFLDLVLHGLHCERDPDTTLPRARRGKSVRR